MNKSKRRDFELKYPDIPPPRPTSGPSPSPEMKAYLKLCAEEIRLELEIQQLKTKAFMKALLNA